VHSVNAGSVYTHLYVGSEAKVSPGGRDVKIKIETKYPWEGQVDISFSLEGKASFNYGFRIPGWCKSCTVKLNGSTVNYTLKDGYALINREWASGDRITVVFDMPVSLVETNPHVRDKSGKLAVTRGPVVYCLEEKDNGKELFKLHAGKPSVFNVKYQKDLLEGLCTVSFIGKKERDWQEDALYRNSADAAYEDKEFLLIPYYAWANRGAGEMRVWINK
jgi:DUF1680 family protein